ncbi:hypothetical protein LZ32DRAFT_107753 [Colletotrichum eremochloae]|nr:hypothetical protein LZ32DRAFT_107753 [Colletotrichum eremochloae]
MFSLDRAFSIRITCGSRGRSPNTASPARVVPLYRRTCPCSLSPGPPIASPPFQGVFLLFYLAPPSVTASYFSILPPFFPPCFLQTRPLPHLLSSNRFFFF